MGIVNKLKISKSNKLFRKQDKSSKKYVFAAKNMKDEIASAQLGNSVRLVIPILFKTLVLYPFVLPFGRKGNVRNALLFKFLPLLGESANTLSLVPQITMETSNSTSGIAWFVSKSEVKELEALLGTQAVFLPAPLVFVPDDDATVIVLYTNDQGASAVLFDNKLPFAYRWFPNTDGSVDAVVSWMTLYSESLGKKAVRTEIYHESLLNQNDLQEKGEYAFSSLVGLDSLNLSGKGADRAREVEAFLDNSFKTVRILTAIGAVFLLFSLALFFMTNSYSDRYEYAPETAYKTVFGEQSRSPVTSALKKLKIITGESRSMTFEQTLSNLTSAWGVLKSPSDIRLDSLRYGTERTEIQGTAGSMNSIQELKESLAKSGFSAKLGDVQQVSGTELRFSVTLTGAGK